MVNWQARASAHLETWRPYTSCYVGLVGLAGAGLAAAHPGGLRLTAAWAIPTMGWLAGLYGGDYFDRELDAISKPQRPIPSGRLRPATALAVMIGLIAMAAALTVLLNWRPLLVVAAATAVGLSYNGFFKARGLAGNLVRGSLTAFAFVFGAVIAQGRVGGGTIVVAAVFALQDTGSNLVGTLRDIDGDRDGGYLTFPVRHGVTATVAVIGGLVAAWSVLAAAAGGITGRGWPVIFVALLAVAVATSCAVTGRLHRFRDQLSRRFALHMHEVLCLERIVLALAFVALGAGPVLALGAGVPALALTRVSQQRLRARHEFAVPAVPVKSY
ncbi:MAG TPA: UbiA family prenyltransferase [Streptosporangiaceae bacterium]|jgi:4-hydroxybenzoate polyprenyltransferase/geranylgeranylglycerol-phosphate geranylgeranyltransferase|nr:UbiA family prenyltransferase [Streptosporangiaceae bacterium]